VEAGEESFCPLQSRVVGVIEGLEAARDDHPEVLIAGIDDFDLIA
jgi:hypothetical protein